MVPEHPRTGRTLGEAGQFCIPLTSQGTSWSSWVLSLCSHLAEPREEKAQAGKLEENLKNLRNLQTC